MIKHAIEAALNPFFVILLLYAGLLIRLYRQKSQRMLFWGFSLVLILLLLLSTPFIAREFTFALENQYPVIDKPDTSSRWIVVFGGGQSDEGHRPANSLLTNVSKSRLIEGVRLYRQLPGATLLLSGGGRSEERSEASNMAILAKWFQVPDSNIALDTTSLNTAEQAKKIKQLLGSQPFYLVTSAIHMPRSMMHCLAEGLHPIAAPADFTLFWDDRIWVKQVFPNPHNLVYLSIALHEILGIGWSKLTGKL